MSDREQSRGTWLVRRWQLRGRSLIELSNINVRYPPLDEDVTSHPSLLADHTP